MKRCCHGWVLAYCISPELHANESYRLCTHVVTHSGNLAAESSEKCKKTAIKRLEEIEYRYIIFNVMKIKFTNRNAVDIFKIRRKKRLNFETFFAQVGTDIQLR